MADQNFRVKRGLEVGFGGTIAVVAPSGNLGIGSTIPTSKLSVVGDALFGGTGIVTATKFVGDGSGLTGIIASGGAGGAGGIVIKDGNTTLGVAGTINFDQNLDVVFATGIATVNVSGFLTAGDSTQWVTNSAGIHTLSNVGIGTTNPTSKLYVRGDAYVTGILTAGALSVGNINSSGILTAVQFFGDGGGLTNLNIEGTVSSEIINIDSNKLYYPTLVDIVSGTIDRFSVSSDSIVFNPGLNRLGIGTTNPLGSFQIGYAGTFSSFVIDTNGNIGLGTITPTSTVTEGVAHRTLHFYSPDSRQVSLRLDNGNAGGNAWLLQSSGGLAGNGQGKFSIYDFKNNLVRFTIDSSGNVGIATTNPVSRLHVSGTTAINSGISTGFKFNPESTELEIYTKDFQNNRRRWLTYPFKPYEHLISGLSTDGSALITELDWLIQNYPGGNSSGIGTFSDNETYWDSLTAAYGFNPDTDLIFHNRLFVGGKHPRSNEDYETGLWISPGGLTGSGNTSGISTISPVIDTDFIYGAGGGGSDGGSLSAKVRLSGYVRGQISDKKEFAAINFDSQIHPYNTNFNRGKTKIWARNEHNYALQQYGSSLIFGTSQKGPSSGDQTYYDRMIIDDNGNVGIGSLIPTSRLDVLGNITSSKLIVTGTGDTTTGAGQIYLNGTIGNRIDFNQNGTGAPSFTTRSVGTKIVLYPNVTGTLVDYGLGIENNTLWYSIEQAVSTKQHRWYAGITTIADLKGSGEFVLGGGTTLTGTASQPLQVTGGAYVSGNTGIGITNPTVRLQLPGISTNTADFKIGEFFVQNYGTNNSFFGNNAPYNGQMHVRQKTGTAEFFQFLNGRFVVRLFPSAGAGTTLVDKSNLFLNDSGEFGIGSSITTKFGSDYRDATFYHSPLGFVGIGTTNSTSRLTVAGDGLFTGVVTATTFYGSGIGLTGLVSSEIVDVSNDQPYFPLLSGNTSGLVTSIAVSSGSIVFNPARNALGIGTTSLFTGGSTGSLTIAGKIVTGNSITHPNISNIITPTVSVGSSGYRSFNLVDTSSAIKIVRVHESFGPILEFHQWNAGITTMLSYWDMAAENDTFSIRNRIGNVDASQRLPGTSDSQLSRLFINSFGNVLIGASNNNVSNNITQSVGYGTANMLQVNGNVYLGGSVGIGTINPLSKLHVVGNNARIDSAFASLEFWKDDSFFGSVGIITNAPGTLTDNDILIKADLSRNIIFHTNGANERLRVSNTGNVGVGTTNPTSRLDVVGDGRYSGVVTATAFYGSGIGLTGILSNEIVDIASGGFYYPILSPVSSGIITSFSVSSSSIVFNPVNKSLGIGTTAARAALEVYSQTLLGDGVRITGTGNLHPAFRLYHEDSGRFAQNLLALSNDAAISGSNLGDYCIRNNGGGDTIFSTDELIGGIGSFTGREKFRITKLGQIGLNSPSPIAAVDIRRQIGFTSTTGPGLSTSTYTGNYVAIGDSGGNVLTINPDGLVGVGTTNPTAPLYVRGDAVFTGIITATRIDAVTDAVIQYVTVNNFQGAKVTITGLSTFVDGPVLIGAGTSTGTFDQKLQVTGSTYISGNLGIGSTNPTSKLTVIGDALITRVAITTTTSTTINLQAGRNYVYYSPGTSLILPSNPIIGDKIEILNRSNAEDSIVLRNGRRIMGLDEDLNIDFIDIGFTLIYTGVSDGWVLGR